MEAKQHSSMHTGPINVSRHYSPMLRIILNFNLLIGILFSTISFAENASISIVYSGEKNYVRSVIKHLYLQLENSPTTINTINIKQESLTKSPIASSTLIISLGTKAAQEVLKHNISVPVLSLLIPSQSYSTLNKIRDEKMPWKVVFIDQTFQRQIKFIQALMGKNKKIGSILGPYSKKLHNKLKTAAANLHQKITIKTIKNGNQLIPTLKSLVRNSDVLIATPDPLTFNKKTIRSILLLTYRQGVPVIGFSKSYVNAGSIAAIFSSPAQVSKQAANIIDDYLDTKKFNSSTFYANDFSIAINKNVARTLSIHLGTKKQIRKRMNGFIP